MFMAKVTCMHDVITIGSALIDIFISSRQFVLRPMSKGTLICQIYGEKVDVDGFSICTGGGASNTAVGFSRAGFNVATVTETGKDTLADVLMAEFHREKVATNYIAQERKEETGGSVILLGEDGGRTAMVHRGASSLLDPHDIPMRALKRCDWIHLSNIAGRMPTLEKIAAALREGKASCSWNPGSAELELISSGQLNPDLLKCQVLILNVEEWKKIRLQQRAFKEAIPEIVVTDGAKGGKLYLKKERRPISFSSSGVRTIDATGAGDAFAVGYVSGRIKGEKPLEAIEWGKANAASVVQHMGAKAGLLNAQQLSKS